MLHGLQREGEEVRDKEGTADWLCHYWLDFRRRFLSLLSFQFRSFPTSLALSVVTNKIKQTQEQGLTKQELDVMMTSYDVKRLEMYCNNLVDYHLIVDLLPALSRLYFLDKMAGLSLSPVQAALLLGMGEQRKVVDTVASELELPVSQLLGLFNRTVRRLVGCVRQVQEQAVAGQLPLPHATDTHAPLPQSLAQEMEQAAKELKIKQDEELKKLKKENLSHYAIKGSEADWCQALSKGTTNLISVKSGEKRPVPSEDPTEQPEPPEHKTKKNKKKNKK